MCIVITRFIGFKRPSKHKQEIFIFQIRDVLKTLVALLLIRLISFQIFSYLRNPIILTTRRFTQHPSAQRSLHAFYPLHFLSSLEASINEHGTLSKCDSAMTVKSVKASEM